MRNMLRTCVALVFLGVISSAANGYYCPVAVCCPPTYTWAYQPQVVTAYRQEWREEKTPVVISKTNYMEEKTKVVVTVSVPKTFVQKVQTPFYVAVPQVVQRDVLKCVMVPVAVVDPCTGCGYVANSPQWVAAKELCTVYAAQLQVREDLVNVVKLVAENRIVDQSRMVPVVTQQPGYTVRRYCVMVPYQTVVNVPVLVQCP